MASVKAIATELNWEVEKNTARGIVQGYRVALIQNIDISGRTPSYKSLVVSFNEITQEKAQQIIEFIQSNKKELKISDFKISTTFVSLFINEGFKGLTKESLNDILVLLISGFTDLDVETPSKCMYCGQETEETVLINKIELTAHNYCHEQAQEEHQEELRNVSYAVPVIGALLGTFVAGLIVFAATLFYAHNLVYLVVGPLTFLGYKLFKGKFTPKAKFIIAGISLVTILFQVFIYVGLVSIDPAIALDGEYLVYVGLAAVISIATGYSMAHKREY